MNSAAVESFPPPANFPCRAGEYKLVAKESTKTVDRRDKTVNRSEGDHEILVLWTHHQPGYEPWQLLRGHTGCPSRHPIEGHERWISQNGDVARLNLHQRFCERIPEFALHNAKAHPGFFLICRG